MGRGNALKKERVFSCSNEWTRAPCSSVGSLYGVYAKSPEGFEEKLLDLLAAGGTKGFKEALEPFGLDPTDPAFWKDSLNAHLGSLMEEAEELSAKLGYTAK